MVEERKTGAELENQGRILGKLEVAGFPGSGFAADHSRLGSCLRAGADRRRVPTGFPVPGGSVGGFKETENKRPDWRIAGKFVPGNPGFERVPVYRLNGNQK